MSIWIIPSLLTILPFVSLMQSCVTDLGNVAVRLKEVVEFGFSQLGSSAIKPRLKPLTDVFLSASHNISEVRSISQHLRGKIYLTTSQRLDLSHNISEVRFISQHLRGKIYLTTSQRLDLSHNISEVRSISQHLLPHFRVKISEVRSMSPHLRGLTYLATSLRYDTSHSISENTSIPQCFRGTVYLTYYT